MERTLAFDVYGTLIDTHGVILMLSGFIGNDAEKFSAMWRQKQLEYSFRRGLMRCYKDFSVCTRESLDYTCDEMQIQLNSNQKDSLMELYGMLPTFKDVKPSLQLLSESNKLVAFSNGSFKAVESLLSHAGLSDFFTDIVSADEIKTFKPDPRIYKHLLTRTKSTEKNTWLISSNPFDVIGAISAGLKTSWIARSEKAIFDPWSIEPNNIARDLLELHKKFELEKVS